MERPNKKKIPKGKEVLFCSDDLTPQFIAMSLTTGKVIELPEGKVFPEQRKLHDALINNNIIDKVRICVRYISKWNVQSEIELCDPRTLSDVNNIYPYGD